MSKQNIISLLFVTLIFPTTGMAAEMIDFNFNNGELSTVIEKYSKATGQRFAVDPQVRGKTTILNPSPISRDEAYNFLSLALARNGFAIVRQPGNAQQQEVLEVVSSRNAQRSGIEVVTQLPDPRPERMITYVRALKNAKAGDVNKEVRILSSKDGEMVPNARTNELIFTDWVSNLYRIEKVLAQIDQKVKMH